MKAFMITSLEFKKSKDTGERHMQRIKQFKDFDVELFKAIKGINAHDFLFKRDIKFLSEKYQSIEFKETKYTITINQ